MLLVLPILIPLVTAIAQILRWRRPVHRAIGAVGAGALLLAAAALLAAVWRDGVQAVQIGGWPAPFGITLVADLLSALMVMVTALIGLAVTIYSLGSMDECRERFGYYPLLSFLLLGVCGAFLTGDLFNLYVWFEIMLIASFVLMVLGGEQAQLEGGIKYVALSLLSSMLFLAAVGLLYSVTGTLNMADMAVRLRHTERPELATAISLLLLVAFGIKAAVFPLFFWLPASYHTPPAAVSAVFAGLLTKVGVYALVRVFTLIFVRDPSLTHGILLVIGGLTMVTGVLGAVAQYEMRRLLAFHIVSQIGYMIMGLGLFTSLGVAGAIFYVIHNIIAKTNLFLVAGLVRRLRGTYELKPLGGLYAARPLLALLFLIPALSLAGLPPLSGFWAKLILIRASFEATHYLIGATALAVSLLTLFSMMKIWNEAFWKPASVDPGQDRPLDPARQISNRELWLHLLPIMLLALCTVAIGLAAGPCLLVVERAAQQLLDPAAYIQAVLGGGSR